MIITELCEASTVACEALRTKLRLNLKIKLQGIKRDVHVINTGCG